jgi:hypothetical protein
MARVCVALSDVIGKPFVEMRTRNKQVKRVVLWGPGEYCRLET